MEGLPERLPVGQVTVKCYLPDLKIYLSRTTGRDFFCPMSSPVLSAIPRIILGPTQVLY